MKLLTFVVVLVAGVVSTPAVAQTPTEKAIVEQGRELFDGMCARCHGVGGTGAEGPNLNRPTLARAPDETSLRTVISDGIAESGMPRVRRFTDNELTALAAYVRAIGRAARTPVAGSRDRGKAIYGRLGCASCHIVAGEGGSFGPELSAIGYARGAAYLRQSIIDPGAVLPKGQLVVPSRGFNEFLPVRVVTNEGREVRGVRINEDAFTIQMRDMAGRLYSFRKSNLEQIVKEVDKSMMPSFKDRLQPPELDDLVAYLAGLGGAK